MTGNFEQKRVKLSTGVELDVVDIGPRDAPVLMFLHGFPESHRTWRFQLPHFSDRFRCIAPDQRGRAQVKAFVEIGKQDPAVSENLGDAFQRQERMRHVRSGLMPWHSGRPRGRRRLGPSVTAASVAHRSHPPVETIGRPS